MTGRKASWVERLRQRRQERAEQNEAGREPAGPLCCVDRNGQRYTTAVAATEDDWWWGALILTPSCIADLRAKGLLPLTEVTP